MITEYSVYTEKFNEDLVHTIAPILKEEIKHFEGEPFNGEILFPKQINLVFSTDLLIFDEAARCFFDSYFNASAALCRAAIDSTLYIASTRELVSKQAFSYDLGHVLNSKGEIKDVNWGTIKAKCLAKKILTASDLEIINDKIRERGNIALHFIQMQDQLLAADFIGDEKYSERIPSMRNMFETEQKNMAKEVLDKTGGYMIEIIKNYFINGVWGQGIPRA